MVCVSDTGVGLPLHQADKIFYAFFTTQPHGTGMGLSISRSIVRIARRPLVGRRQLSTRRHVSRRSTRRRPQWRRSLAVPTSST